MQRQRSQNDRTIVCIKVQNYTIGSKMASPGKGDGSGRIQEIDYLPDLEVERRHTRTPQLDNCPLRNAETFLSRRNILLVHPFRLFPRHNMARETNIGGAEVRVEYEPVGHVESHFGAEVEKVEHVLPSQRESSIEESYGEFFLWIGGGDRCDPDACFTCAGFGLQYKALRPYMTIAYCG